MSSSQHPPAFAPASRATGPAPTIGVRHTSRGLGLPLVVIIALATLAVPRIIAHDLELVEPGSPANTALAVLPPVIWIAVAMLWARRPLLSLFVAGGLLGVALALIHNLSWGVVFGEDPPRLGGALDGVLAPGLEEAVLRGAGTISSLATGLATGVVCGLIAWGLQALVRASGGRLPI